MAIDWIQMELQQSQSFIRNQLILLGYGIMFERTTKIQSVIWSAIIWIFIKTIIDEWSQDKESGKKIREAVFVLTSELMKIYFSGFSSKDSKMKKIEIALRNRQFIQFELSKLYL